MLANFLREITYGMCRTHPESLKGDPGTRKSLKEDVQSKHRLVTQAVHKSKHLLYAGAQVHEGSPVTAGQPNG